MILVYLPLYSPDLNPIEEFFAELKAFIKKHWQIYTMIRARVLTCSWNGVLTWQGLTSIVQEGVSATQA
jgi:transposase